MWIMLVSIFSNDLINKFHCTSNWQPSVISKVHCPCLCVLVVTDNDNWLKMFVSHNCLTN